MAKVVFENVYKSYPRSRAEDVSVASDIRIPKIEGNQNHPKQKSSNHSVSVLRNIDFTVEDGEFMVLVGPSGCGKSTLLRMLAGLEELTGGNIYVGDRLINSLPPKARDIAMVFQNYALYPHLNVYDNIAFGLRRTVNQSLKSNSIEDILTGLTRSLPKGLRYHSAKEKEIAKRVKYVASLLQIESLLTRLPKELSGGQKQRVALGRAIARNPQVFLMDEPLSNLDAKLRTSTRAQIVQLQRQLGTTTIYVTHDQIEAMTMGDRIAVMNEGKIQQIAPPLEIYHHPVNRFVAEFIGSPPMNFIPVTYVAPLTLIHPQFCLTLPETWIEPLQGYKEKQLLLGIRPEHFSLSTVSEQNLAVVVNLVEALGNETYLSVHLAEEKNTTLQVKIPGDKAIARGESLHLAIDLNKIHLFAENTGESLRFSSESSI
ncbi:MAG: ABC transporter ATP-binding protein [Xenococcaceae cyanobacterium MO_188.B29]|nr:ABC transporter ATP-binding protein [Xenococcaceae cyanobacterium MO_188.B29]